MKYFILIGYILRGLACLMFSVCIAAAGWALGAGNMDNLTRALGLAVCAVGVFVLGAALESIENL